MKIAVGGMIASGKTVLVKRLAEKTGYAYMEEFAKDDVVFNTLLNWLYAGVANVEMLLQVYFLHNHWVKQKEYNSDVIVDKHIIENLIFARENLKTKPDILRLYISLFEQYVNNIKKPDLYIILSVDWDRFEERLFKRGRPQEIDNFKENIEYFKNLISSYVEDLEEMCQRYNIQYVNIDTTNLSEDEVLSEALKYVNLILTRTEHN